MIRSLGAARLVSTPSRLTSGPGLARDCHTTEVSPTLSSSASLVSQASTQVFSSPLRLPFRHARVEVGLSSYNRAGMLGRHARFLVSSLRQNWYQSAWPNMSRNFFRVEYLPY